jgi:hypothetical protein
MQHDRAADALADFLAHADDQQRDQPRMVHHQAHQHRHLGQLIRDGIKNLTQIGDLVKMPRDISVQTIGQTGQRQHHK